MARRMALAGLVVASLAGSTSAACQYFYSGYCPGTNCICTFGNSCTDSAAAKAGWDKIAKVASVTKSRRCVAAGGTCRKTASGCSGTNCKNNIGACAAPASPYATPSGPNGPDSYGVDVGPATVTKAVAECFVRNKVSFAIMRVSRTTGTVDYNGIQNVVNAQKAGIKEVDGYIFPTFRVDPAVQIYNLKAALVKKGVTINRIWLDIEKHNYPADFAKNRAFVTKMLQAAEDNQKGFGPGKVGFYTSKTMWESILGTGFTLGGNLPLWYSHYDKRKDFTQFKRFGGWTKPTWKQYAPDVLVCGVGTDVNWRPSGSGGPSSSPSSSPTSSPGASQTCASVEPWSSSGMYCSPDRKAVWYCTSRTAVPRVRACPNGCQVGAPGTPDMCKSSGNPVAPTTPTTPNSRNTLRCNLSQIGWMAKNQVRIASACNPSDRAKWGLDTSFISMCVKQATKKNPPNDCSTRYWRAGTQNFVKGDVIGTFVNEKTYQPTASFGGHVAVFDSKAANGCLNVWHAGFAGKTWLYKGTICKNRYCRLCDPALYYKVVVSGYNNGGAEEFEGAEAQGAGGLAGFRRHATALPMVVVAGVAAVALLAIVVVVVVRRRQASEAELSEVEEPLSEIVESQE